jgi:hypothetical protein
MPVHPHADRRSRLAAAVEELARVEQATSMSSAAWAKSTGWMSSGHGGGMTVR